MSEKRYGMQIDLSLCIGCNACAVACKEENDVPTGKFNTWVESWDTTSKKGTVTRAQLPRLCNHCSDPACVSVCPTGASYIGEGGIVLIDDNRCIGCKYCMTACPYEVRWVDDDAGDVHKCTFCNHRSQNGLLPACVSTCVTKARVFGNLNDPESDISKRIAEADQVEVLLEDANLEPNVYYIGLSQNYANGRSSAIHKGGNVAVAYKGEN